MDIQNKNDFTEKIMSEIKEKKVTMRSHLYFVFGTIITIFGMFLMLLVGVFSINFFSFHYRTMSPAPFISPIPWLFLLVGLLAIWGGIILIKKYDLSYKNNFLLIASILIVAVLACGFFIDELGFNEKLHPQRVLHKMYRQFPQGDWVTGRVLEISNTKIVLETEEGIKKDILINEETKLPPFPINIGEIVRVIVKTEGESFYALGIGPEKNKGRSRMYMLPPEKIRAL